MIKLWGYILEIWPLILYSDIDTLIYVNPFRFCQTSFLFCKVVCLYVDMEREKFNPCFRLWFCEYAICPFRIP